MLHVPFYDPARSYHENYDNGPYGDFSDGKTYPQEGEPTYDFLGQKVFLPFGIPAGPIINSNFAKGAFDKGFDIVVYKTIRSEYYPSHPFPNILSVDIKGDLTPDKMSGNLVANKNYYEPLSITNSFGVPSRTPDVWQEDVKKAIGFAGVGQVLVLSFMGTVKENQTQEEFINDYALAAELSLETGAKILETNLSCPNIGDEGLVCYNLEVTEKVCYAIKNVIGNTPLIIKVGYYKEDQQLEKLAEIAEKYVQGISGINTLQVGIVNSRGEQALPGKNRKRSGVCGATIKWAGLETVRKLMNIRKKRNYSFSIEGVGGATLPEDYFEYLKAGADSVMSATGAMWNPYLAQEIKESEEKAMEIINNWSTSRI